MSKDTKPPSRSAAQFVVRLPDGMRDRIAAEAEKNKRSMNAEIVARLEASLAQTDPNQFVNMQQYNELKQEILEYVLDSIDAKKKAGK
ncbi:Arc family DNA-binding protein [Paraburkholderia tropica]|uniref:Arc family DNA-binding protein n=1 Tax=Paraburkholderia tropica TaxID=92647 RepID=UPI0016002DD4|nr:Arc family DNA-binding protein [Paraburkholderia tropica]QNB13421.1 Arc family DNA-binding protein [Paraburkholderia tropica]